LNKIFTIAEIAQAHDGSLGIAHSYIDALAETGVDAIKFQIHIAEAESSLYEPFRTKFSYEDATRYDYWKRMEFTTDHWFGLKKHCEDKGLEFIASPFSNKAVEILEKLGVSKYKIGSGEVNNHLMLEVIAQTGKEIVLSSGMSNYRELDEAFACIAPFKNAISILQCTTSYPTTPEHWGLHVMQELKTRYKVPVGFSDHSGDIFACLCAACLGAEILEFHAVFDKRMFGPDALASIEIDDIKRLVKGVRQIEISANHPIDKNDINQFTELKNIFEKSLAVNKTLQAGHIVKLTDLESKKPKGKGIDAQLYKTVIGKKLRRNLEQWEFLNITDFDND